MTDTQQNMSQNREQVREAIAAKAEEKENPPKKSAFGKFMDASDRIDGKLKGAFRRAFGPTAVRKDLQAGPKRPEDNPKGPTDVPPKSPGPEFKVPTLPDWYWKAIGAVSRAMAKVLLAAAVLTGFAEKKTQEPTAGDKEPPKATLNVGTLGVTVAKVKINNGDKTTDFDGNMPLAKAAKEVVGKVLPQSEQDKLFEDKPIENGAFGDIADSMARKGVFGRALKEMTPKKSNGALLKEGSTEKSKPASQKIPDKVLADKLGKEI